MKFRIVSLLVFLTLFGAARAQKVEVHEGGFFINDSAITRTTSASLIRQLLGPPDRIERLANNIWVYDEKGMYFYWDPSDSSLKAMTIDYGKTDYRFSPKKSFTGQYLLARKPVTRTTAMATLKSWPELQFVQDWLMDNALYAGLSLFFTYEEKDTAQQTLISTSINFPSLKRGPQDR